MSKEQELIDFVRYALHESMLPHHFGKHDSDWRSTRVALEAQKLLNKYSLKQSKPENYTLLHDEEYYGKQNLPHKKETFWDKFKTWLME